MKKDLDVIQYINDITHTIYELVFKECYDKTCRVKLNINNKYMNIHDKIDKFNLKTGDIVLFHGEGFWFSYLVERFTKSQYSHIGMILKDPTYIDDKLKGIYLLESGKEDFRDAENDQMKFGVQITDFKKMVESYRGNIYIRKLNTKIFVNFDKQIEKLHGIIHNKRYDDTISDLLKADLHIKSKDDRRVDKFFCSALVAYVYCQLGLLDSDIDWCLFAPIDFDSQHLIALNNDAFLDKEELLK
jgi:hypothetical protein